MQADPRRSLTIKVLLTSTLIGCGDGNGGLADPEPLPDVTPAGIGVVSGISQSGVVGTELAEPLVAKVVNRIGAPLPGITVNWVVEAGGGSFASQASVTDPGGFAQTTYTLGDTPGENSMLAVVPGTTLFTRFLAMALPAEGSRTVHGAPDGRPQPTGPEHHLHVRNSPTVQGEKVPLSPSTGAVQLGNTPPPRAQALIVNTPGGTPCSSKSPPCASPDSRRRHSCC